MSCLRVAPGVVVCGSFGNPVGRRVIRCPTEDRRRRMVVTFGGYSGNYTTCLGCGDTWDDGMLCPRPFMPNWRQKAVAEAKAKWPAALSPPQFWAAARERLGP